MNTITDLLKMMLWCGEISLHEMKFTNLLRLLFGFANLPYMKLLLEQIWS